MTEPHSFDNFIRAYQGENGMAKATATIPLTELAELHATRSERNVLEARVDRLERALGEREGAPVVVLTLDEVAELETARRDAEILAEANANLHYHLTEERRSRKLWRDEAETANAEAHRLDRDLGTTRAILAGVREDGAQRIGELEQLTNTNFAILNEVINQKSATIEDLMGQVEDLQEYARELQGARDEIGAAFAGASDRIAELDAALAGCQDGRAFERGDLAKTERLLEGTRRDMDRLVRRYADLRAERDEAREAYRDAVADWERQRERTRVWRKLATDKHRKMMMWRRRAEIWRKDYNRDTDKLRGIIEETRHAAAALEADREREIYRVSHYKRQRDASRKDVRTLWRVEAELRKDLALYKEYLQATAATLYRERWERGDHPIQRLERERAAVGGGTDNPVPTTSRAAADTPDAHERVSPEDKLRGADTDRVWFAPAAEPGMLKGAPRHGKTMQFVLEMLGFINRPDRDSWERRMERGTWR